MKLRPLNDNILVKRLESESKTEGGLFIPDQAKEKPQRGEVLAVGPGKIWPAIEISHGTGQTGCAHGHSRIELPPSVKPGDVVLFGKYTGTEIEIEREKYVVIKEEDVLGVLET